MPVTKNRLSAEGKVVLSKGREVLCNKVERWLRKAVLEMWWIRCLVDERKMGMYKMRVNRKTCGLKPIHVKNCGGVAAI